MPDGRPTLRLGRRIAAAIGVIIMVLSGGCSLVVLSGPDIHVTHTLALILGGIPFLIGFLIFLAAVSGS